MAELVNDAVHREMNGANSIVQGHSHRVPLGLMLVERGLITPVQLREALAEQRKFEQDCRSRIPLGRWLVDQGVLTEIDLTRAIGVQWSCPVFAVEGWPAHQLSSAIPRFLGNILGALPLQLTAGRRLYVAFCDQIDRRLCYALEHMHQLRVTAGVVRDSEFRRIRAMYSEAGSPRVRFPEAASTTVLTSAVTKLLESEKPVEARLTRVREFYWLRVWHKVRPESSPLLGENAEDLVCTIRRSFAQST